MLTSKNSFVKIWRTREIKFCALLRTLARCFVILCIVAIYATKELISVLVISQGAFLLGR
jgi:hypothetical protein